MPEVKPTLNSIQNEFVATMKANPGLSDAEILQKFPEIGQATSNTKEGVAYLRSYYAEATSGKYKSVDELKSAYTPEKHQEITTQKSTTTTATSPNANALDAVQNEFVATMKVNPGLSDDEILQKFPEIVTSGVDPTEGVAYLRDYYAEATSGKYSSLEELKTSYALKKKDQSQESLPSTGTSSTENLQPSTSEVLPIENSQLPLVGSTSELEPSTSGLPAQEVNQPLGPYKAGLGNIAPVNQGTETSRGETTPIQRTEGQVPIETEESSIFDAISYDPRLNLNPVKDAETKTLWLDSNTGLPLGIPKVDKEVEDYVQSLTGMQSNIEREKAQFGKSAIETKQDEEYMTGLEQSLEKKLSLMFGLSPEVIQENKGEWALKSKLIAQGEDASLESFLSEDDIKVRDKYASEELKLKGTEIKTAEFKKIVDQVGVEKAHEIWKKKFDDFGMSNVSEDDLKIKSLKDKIGELELKENKTTEDLIALKKYNSELDTLIDFRLTGERMFDADGKFISNKKIQVDNPQEVTDKVNKYAVLYENTDVGTLYKMRDNAFFQYLYSKKEYDKKKAEYDQKWGDTEFDYKAGDDAALYNSDLREISEMKKFSDDRFANYLAVNRVLVTNSDPGTEAEDGFGRGIIEGFKGGMGIVSESVSALNDRAITQLESEGYVLNTAQKDKLGKDFFEKAGEAVGSSIPASVKIGISILAANKISGALAIPKLAQAIAKGNKVRQFGLEMIYDATIQGSAFAVSGENFSAGIGEGIGQTIGSALLSRFGVKNKLINFGVRTATGATTETAAEYSGQFLDELEKNGFNWKKASENTFGKTAGDAWEKLAITYMVGLTLGVGGGSQKSNLFMSEAQKELRASGSDSPTVAEAIKNDVTIPPSPEEIKKKDEILARKSSGEEITEQEIVEAELTSTREEFQEAEKVEHVEASPVIIQNEKAETEYTTSDGKFISEKELLAKLDDEQYVQKIKDGTEGLNTVNPSPEIEAKIKEKFPENTEVSKAESSSEKEQVIVAPKLNTIATLDGLENTRQEDSSIPTQKDPRMSGKILSAPEIKTENGITTVNVPIADNTGRPGAGSISFKNTTGKTDADILVEVKKVDTGLGNKEYVSAVEEAILSTTTKLNETNIPTTPAQETAKPSDTGVKKEVPVVPTSESITKPKINEAITGDAILFLNSGKRRGFLPNISREIKKIAIENNIPITKETTSQDVFDALEKKRISQESEFNKSTFDKKEKLVKTKEFENWAGEKPGGVIKDENGNPKVLYHGGASEISDFYDRVNWFTDSPELATQFGIKGGSRTKTKRGKVVTNTPKLNPSLIRLKNPLKLNYDVGERVSLREILKDNGYSEAEASKLINRMFETSPGVIDNAKENKKRIKKGEEQKFFDYDETGTSGYSENKQSKDTGRFGEVKISAYGWFDQQHIVAVLKENGIDGVVTQEGGATTYGVFDKSDIKPINSQGATTNETETKTETQASVLESEKSSEKEQKVKKIKEATTKLSETIRSGKIKISGLDKLSSSPKPIFDAAWNTALEAIALTIDAGGSVTQAIADGIRAIQKTDWYKSLSEEGKEKSQDMIAQGLSDQLEAEVAKSPAEKIAPDKKAEQKTEQTQKKEKSEKKERVKSEKHRQSKIAANHARSQDPATAKEILDKTRYKKHNQKQGAKQIDDLYEELGSWKAAVDYVNGDNGVDPIIKNNLKLDAAAKMIKEGNGTNNQQMIADGESLIVEISLERTKTGQDIAMINEIYNRNPEMFWRAKIDSIVGKKKRDTLSQEYSEGETVSDAIKQVQEELQSEIDGLKEEVKKVSEQLAEQIKIAKTKTQADNEANISQKKKSVKAEIQAGWDKIALGMKGKGGTANMGLPPLLREGIVDVIVGYVKLGTLSSKQIVSKVYNGLKNIGATLTKENVRHIAESLDGFRSHQNTEKTKAFYEKVKAILNTKQEVNASTIDAMVSNPESLWEQYQQNIIAKIKAKISQIAESDLKQKAELEKLANKIATETNAKIQEILAGNKKKEGATKEKVSAKDTLIDLMANSDKIQELYNTILSDPKVSQETKTAINELINSEVVFSETLVSNMINESLREQGKTINDIITSHYTGKNKFVGHLSETLVREAGLSVEEAAYMADFFNEKMQSILEVKSQKALEKFFAKSIKSEEIQEAIKSGNITPEIQKEIDKRVKTKENRKLAKQVTKAINLGALESPQFVNAFANKFGFNDIDPFTAGKINSLIGEIERLRSPEETTKTIDGKEVNTFQREKVLALEKELNTVIDSLSEKNFSYFAENFIALKYLSVLSGIGTQINATTGAIAGSSINTLAFTARNLTSLRGLILGVINGSKALSSASSRATLSRRGGAVEVGQGTGGYEQSSSTKMSGASESKLTGVERQVLRGFKKATEQIKEGKITRGTLNFIASAVLQPLRMFHLLSASDAFVSTFLSQLVLTTQVYNKTAKELKMNPLQIFTGSGGLTKKVQEALNQDLASKESFKALAEEEFNKIEDGVREELRKEGLTGAKFESELNKRLKKQIGGVKITSNPKSTYVTRRSQELKENQNLDKFNYASGMVKDWLLLGNPDGIMGAVAKGIQSAGRVTPQDNAIQIALKSSLQLVFMFQRLAANSFNAIKTSTPFLGALDAVVGFGFDPKTGELQTGKTVKEVAKNFFGSKHRVDPERVYQRLMVNAITTSVMAAVMMNMFEWDDEEKDFKLDPNRSFDILGPGHFSISKNLKAIEDFQKFSFSITKDKNGNWTDYTKTNLSPALQAIVAFASAFSDDEKGLGSSGDIQDRKGQPMTKLFKGTVLNPFQAWWEGSFNSIGRLIKSAQYEETTGEGLVAVGQQIILDNTKAVIQPAIYRDVARYIQKEMGVQTKVTESFVDKFISGLYGADFMLEEKTDMFGNTYPVTDAYDKWIGGVEKMSEKHPEVALLYKFEGGLNINKWEATGFEKNGTFSMGGAKFESTSDDVQQKVIARQQEIFKEMVSEEYDNLNSIDNKFELEKILSKLQTVSKEVAKAELFEGLLEDGLIVIKLPTFE